MKTGVLVTGVSALVSGATGFLGGRLVNHLQRAGYRVRILTRDNSDLTALSGGEFEIVKGDLDDEESLRHAVDGVNVVFHTAGKVTDWAPRKEFFRVNTYGTERLINACLQASVRRLVHVSSLTVLGLPRDGAPVNEETPPAEAPRDPYSASKLAAEQRIRTACVHRGLDAVIVRPGVIWGPGEITIVPRIAGLLKKGRMVYIGRADNILALSHVDNLCTALLLAAAAPAASGQIYHITDGEEITARQAIDTLASAMNVPKPSLSLPFPILYGAAAFMEWTAKRMGSQKPPMLSRYGVRLIACDSRYDIDKARRELGYTPVKRFYAGIEELNLAEEPQ